MAPKKGSGSKTGASKKQTSVVATNDNIVFEDDNKKRKEKTSKPTQEGSAGPPKPTARQVVGGASWTGKLPVNLLSEHCQRQKWNKPDYSMRQIAGRDGGDKLYRSDVILSKTDPKSKETTKLPPIRLPASEAHLADEPSALEARHFAATYTLFRIQSMKNIHMTLPPKYRDLWKGEFSRLKKEDVGTGHGWKYDEDPFAAEVKRQEIHRAMEKRKEEEEKKMLHAQVQQDNGGPLLPTHDKLNTKEWDRAPHMVMGSQIRAEVETLVRKKAGWNRHGLNLTRQQRDEILGDVVRLGFRKSHVEEALSDCMDKQEVLEWLIVHIPEDDLPRWTLPSNYNAGISLASGDVEKAAKLERLASAGYPSEVCAQVLRHNDGDERLAAFQLQQLLMFTTEPAKESELDSLFAWQEEIQTLEAIFGENFTRIGELQCSISMSTSAGQAFTACFRCPARGYPHVTVPAISVDIANAAAYVRLSSTKKAIRYAQSELLGEVMIYNVCQWLETEIPSIIETPGMLSDIRLMQMTSSTIAHQEDDNKGKAVVRADHKRSATKHQRKDKRSDSEILQQWRSRHASSEQTKMVEIRQRLPAWAKQDEIIQAIEAQQVTIISGETGSGKSTQVVQFVLDSMVQNLQGSQANIICTQPRRVATLSLAERVSDERCSQVGGEVGYVIRGESKTSESTKITFMTTGVLLRRLQSFVSMKDALTEVSHIFVDEVHERSLDTDFLLALLRECMRLRPKLKIILMSATLDADVFTSYFGGPKLVTVVTIQGRTFPVQDLYLEDAIALVNPGLDQTGIGKSIQNLGFGINYDLIRDLVHHIDRELGDEFGSILIFLPGTMEIERCLRALSSTPKFQGLPLHASLLPAEQRKVFPLAPAGRRKVVAATNVAETSITIEDIVAVIDTGKVKETSYDAENNIVRLEEVWASQAACKQRRGRAGRVQAGICYKLFTRNSELKMTAKNLPEIQRVPLEQLCLSVKATGVNRDIAEFLSRTLTPPESGAVSNAIKTLHTMNALEDGRLTALGSYLAMIPADLRCAKMIVYGALFNCLEPCLTIASILTVKSPFVSPRAAREEASEARSKFFGSNGDLILEMAAYDEWADLTQVLRHGQLLDWCSHHFISNQTMRDISSTRRQILDSLKDIGLVSFDYKSPKRSEPIVKANDEITLIAALVAASLQPQLAVISFPSKKYIASMSGAKELDPEARTIKFFIPTESSAPASSNTTPLSSRPSTPRPNVLASSSGNKEVSTGERLHQLSRVFIHPASCLFSAQTFPRHSTHVSYFTKMMTTKPFIRDLTPLNIYSLLLFGGKLRFDTAGRGLVVGDIWKVQGWARIGVLISRLRVLLDEELQKNFEEGGVLMGAMDKSRIVPLVRRLLVLNGQDK